MVFTVKNVGKRFGSTFVVRHVSFSLPSQGFVAIKGKSGSGKSTLLNLLSGLLRPEEGAVYYQGRNLAHFNAVKMRRFRLKETAMLFQHYNLIDGANGLENVALPLRLAGIGKRKAEKEANKLFARFNIQDLAEKNVDVCSGGEKQRIALLRSLIQRPKVLFCDEPTGALDEANAKFIMESLKQEAKKRLIVMVSHNEELIESFADSIIVVEQKQARFAKKASIKSETKPMEETRLPRGRGWAPFFTGRNLKRNALIDAIGFLGMLIGFSSLLITAGFYQGSKRVLEEEPKKSASYRCLSVSEKYYLESEGSPLKLVRRRRPERENVFDLLSAIEGVEVVPDYSFFFPSGHAFQIDGAAKPATSFQVYGSFDESILLEGSAPSPYELGCVVNEEFIAQYPEAKIGSEIAFSENYSLNYLGSIDEGMFRYSFILTGIISEFSFLSSEKVYIPYYALSGMLMKEKLPNLSAHFAQEITAANANEYLPNDHSVAGYQYLLFAKDDEAAETLFEKKIALESEENPLALSSSAYDAKKAFGDLTNAFSLSLLVFVGIAFLGVGLILAMTAYSGFMKRRKETAMLLVLGGAESEIGAIYLMEEVLLAVLAAGLSLLLSPLLQKGADAYLFTHFSMSGLVQIPLASFVGIPYLVPMALFLFALIISSLACLVPLRAIGRMPLAEILHDE